MIRQNEPKSLERTIEIVPPRKARDEAGQRAMAIIEGSTPVRVRKPNDLLRRRLRAASLILFGGFFAFFIRSLFYLDRIETTLDWVLFVNHGLVMATTGLVGVRLVIESSLHPTTPSRV